MSTASVRGVDPEPLSVSVVIISKDEGRAIERCVRSVSAYSEVFVVDSYSSDGTQEIAAAAGAVVVPFSWNGAYPKKKQWTLDNLPLSHDWVLFLDGDEYSTPEFDAEVRMRVTQPDASAYDVPLDYVFLGRHLRHGHKVYKRVLFDRHRCGWRELDDLSVEQPLEMELHVQPEVDGEIGRMNARIVHDDLEPLAHWFDRHNRYSDWEAVLKQSNADEHTADRTRQGQIWERVPGKPALFFLYSYLARRGFLDGYAGLSYSLANAFYWWQVNLKVRELKRSTAGVPHVQSR
jgi:glycosyltransferase involved in cell wall biosynthesis